MVDDAGAMWVLHQSGGPFSTVNLGEPVDVNDNNAVWQDLAGLMSFPVGRGWLPLTESLYLSYRANNNYTPGGDVDKLAEQLLDRFDALAKTPNPYLHRADENALAGSSAIGSISPYSMNRRG